MENQSIEEWLKAFRAKDKSGWSNVELDFDDNVIADLKEAASELGMTIDEYCNYALFQTLNNYSRCDTCKRARLDRSQQCVYCGEID